MTHFSPKGSRTKFTLLFSVIALFLVSGCATESHQALVVDKVNSASTPYSGIKSSLVVGKFENKSSFMRGLFSDGVDRLGSQAKTILLSHLQQTNHFNVMDRDNMSEAKFEANLGGKTQSIKRHF